MHYKSENKNGATNSEGKKQIETIELVILAFCMSTETNRLRQRHRTQPSVDNYTNVQLKRWGDFDHVLVQNPQTSNVDRKRLNNGSYLER